MQSVDIQNKTLTRDGQKKRPYNQEKKKSETILRNIRIPIIGKRYGQRS